MIGTKLIKYRNCIRTTYSMRTLLVGVCAVLLLGACGNQSFLDKLPSLGDGDMKDSTSHMEPQKTTSASNPKNLFGNSLRSDEERLARLERAVQNMRNEFDNVSPSIRRLMAIEGDIQNLITELRKLTEEPQLLTAPRPVAPSTTPQIVNNAQRTAAPAQNKMSKVEPAKKVQKAKKSYTQKTPPPVSGGKASIYDVRVGEHPGKTRIVLDSNTKTGFNVDLDNGENILIVELPQAGWNASTSRRFSKSSFIESYNVETGADGSMLIVQLKRNARIGYKDDLPGSNGGRRIVIDIEGS